MLDEIGFLGLLWFVTYDSAECMISTLNVILYSPSHIYNMSLLLDGRDSPMGCTCYIKQHEAHLINAMVVFLSRFHLPKDKTDWRRETGLYFPH